MSPSRRNSITKGLLNLLLSDSVGETINSVVTKLYKKSDFDLDRAQRGVVFLDGLDKLCINTDRNGDENAKKQVFEEIFKVVSGTMINVSRLVDRGMSVEDAAKTLFKDENQVNNFENCGEFLDTSSMFFVGFGGPPDGFERAKEEQEEQNKNKLSPNDPRLHSPASGAVSLIENDKNGGDDRKLSSGHYSGGSNYSDRQTPTRTNRQQQQGAKEGKKEPGDGPGGGDKRKDSGYGGSGVVKETRPKKQYDDLYEDDGYDDDYYDDDESIEDEEAKQLSRLLEVCETDLHEADSKFKQFQKLWGMQDIEFEFEDGALETIATQAMYQQTGQNGISNILEKLFMTIKFDIPSPQFGKRVSKIRVSEASVIGTKRPIYYFESYSRQTSVDSGLDEITQSRKPSIVISETNSKQQRDTSKRSIHSNTTPSSPLYYHRNISANLAPIREEAKSIPKSEYLYQEFELEMLDQMDL